MSTDHTPAAPAPAVETAAVCPACGTRTTVPVAGLTADTEIYCAGPDCWQVFRPRDNADEFFHPRAALCLTGAAAARGEG